MKRLFSPILTTLIACTISLNGQATIRVVTTIPDFGAIAKEVGGDLVRVDSLVRPTQNPHYVDGKPSLMVLLNRADLLLITGMELERGWLPPLVTGARNSKIQKGRDGYLDCSTLIVPMQVETPDRSKGDIHPGGNPHYWTDPRNGLRLADGISKRLIALDPQNEARYRARLDDFKKLLRQKIAEWNKKLSPFKGTKVVTYHRSWIYLLNWIGYEELGTLEPKPGIPPTPAHVAELIKRSRDQKVKLMIQESFYPTRMSRIFAEKAGTTIKILPTMVGADGTKSYIDLIDRLVNALTSL